MCLLLWHTRRARRRRSVGGVVRARLDGDRDGLLVFFVCIILLCVAAAVNPFTNLLVAASPVVMLASGVTIARPTPYTSRRVVGQWGGAGGACCEDHFAFAVSYWVFSGLDRLEKPDFSAHPKKKARRERCTYAINIKKTSLTPPPSSPLTHSAPPTAFYSTRTSRRGRLIETRPV